MSNKIRSNIKIIANLLKDEKILTVEEMLRGSFKRHKLQHNKNLWAKADPSMEMIKWTKFMRAKEIFEAFKRENKLMPYATDAYLKMNPCPPKSIRRTQRRRRRRRQLRMPVWSAFFLLYQFGYVGSMRSSDLGSGLVQGTVKDDVVQN